MAKIKLGFSLKEYFYAVVLFVWSLGLVAIFDLEADLASIPNVQALTVMLISIIVFAVSAVMTAKNKQEETLQKDSTKTGVDESA